jgi:catechol 2,3-dioxygenase-like lactoylglutathione lyase family enzyme
MAAAGLHHINVRTTPELLETTRAFYEDFLGYKVGPRPPFRSGGYWMYDGDHPWVHISTTTPGAGKPRLQPDNLDAGFGHIAHYGGDYRALKRKLEKRGMEYDERPTPDETLMQVFFSDPNGVRVEAVFPIGEARSAAKKPGKKLAVRA